MARQVSELLIRLGIEGYEGVDKLKGAFRDLDRVAQLSGRQIDDIRTRITNFGAESGRTEQLIRGQLEALRGLRTQAEFGSRAFTELTGDINILQAELRGSTDAIERQREALVRSAGASNQNARAIERQIAGLERLRQQTRPGSSAFVQLSNDIQRATADLGRFRTEASQAASTLTQMPGASLEIMARQIGIFQRRMQSLNITTQEFLRYQQRIDLISTVRSTTVGRQELRATTAMYESPQYREYAGGRSLRLELPDTLAAIRFRVNEINTELENITGYERRRQLTIELSELNRRLRNSVLEVTTQEDLAVAAVRRRVNAQRELLRTSGFGAFSREVSQTTPSGAVERSIERNRQKRLRQGILSEAEQTNLQGLINNYVGALENRANVARQSYTNLLGVQEIYNRRAIELEDKKNAALLASQQATVDAEGALFLKRLNAANVVANRTAQFRSSIGLGGFEGLSGPDLSPLYSEIVALSSAAGRRRAQLMKRSPTQAFNDLVTAFNTGATTGPLETQSVGIGASIAEGVAQGAQSSAATQKGAKTFADKLIAAYKQAFRIKSPSGESRDKIGIPLGQGIGEGIVEGIKSFKAQIQAALRDVAATPGKVSPVRVIGPTSDVAERLQAFLARTTTTPSTYRPLARLMGESVLSSPALQEAVYRRAYEKGTLTPSVFLPTDVRRGLRGTPGLPGANLEQLIRSGAFSAVSGTGAFVGPLGGPQVAPGAVSSLYSSLYSRRALAQLPNLATSSPLFGAPTAPSAAAIYRELVRSLAPQRFSFGLGPAPQAFGQPQVQGLRSSSSNLGPNYFTAQPFGTVMPIPLLRNPGVKLPEIVGTLPEFKKLGNSLSLLATDVVKARAKINEIGFQNLPTKLIGLQGAAFDAALTKALNAKRGITPYAGQVRPLFAASDYPAMQLGLPGTGFTMASPYIERDRLFTQIANNAGKGRYYTTSAGETRQYGFPLEGMMGPSSVMRQPATAMTDLNTTLAKFGPLSKRSISDIKELSAALRTFAETAITPADEDYKRLNATIAKQDALIERELAKRERGKRRRFSGMQFAQTAGAVLSGGIFGGPEGLLGGVIGGAFGGVGGAFAGSAIGGQLSMVRQQLAYSAELSAALTRQRTALAGVVYTYSDYIAAIQATEAISKRFNIPITDTTTQFTRLSAAMLGSGKNIKDATFALEAVTQAIKGTGGGAEQIQGTLLALTQVFSKGKVSAEELNQMAERLPGTFTLFAQAAGKSGPELQKALQNGKVTLDDLMRFLELLSKKYAKTADDIAKSSQDAGARFSKTLQDFQITAGSALEGTGADFQNFGTRVIRVLDSVIKKLVELGAIKPGAQYYIGQIESGQLSVRTLEQRLLEAGAKAAERGNINPMLRGILYPEVTQAEKEVRIYEQALVEIRRRQTLANKPGGAPPKRSADVDETPEQKRARDKAARDAQVAAEQEQRRNEAIAQQEIRLADDVFKRRIELEEQFYQRRKELADLTAQNELRLLFGTARERAAADLRYKQSVEEYDRRIAAARTAVSQAQLDLSGRQRMAAVTAGSLLPGPVGAMVPSPTGIIARTGSTGQSTGPHLDARWADGRRITAADVDRYLMVNGRTPSSYGVTSPYGPRRMFGRSFHAGVDLGTPSGSAITLKSGASYLRDLGFTGAGGYAIEIDTAEGRMRLLHLKAGSAARVSAPAASGRLRAAVASQINRNITDQGDILASEGKLSAAQATLSGLLQDKPAFEKAAAKTLLLDYTEAIRQQNEELTKELRLSKERIGLQMEGHTEAYIELQLQLNENTREQNRLRIDALTADKEQAVAIKDSLEQYRKQADLLREIYDLQENAKRGFGFREGARQYVESIGTMKEATAQLTLNGIKGLEESLFSLATTGTANFNQFASELLKQTARIILQQLVLKPLLDGIRSLFGGPAAASGVGSLGPAALNFGPMGPGISAFSANGNAFAANGIVPYAMGGIVQSPTLFRYANGGVPGTGLMGEAGPEAIIPLQRGRNGKLGVAGGGGTTNITVNVDASGTSTGNDPGQAAALGRVISQAVQAELVKQKRPGGILSR